MGGVVERKSPREHWELAGAIYGELGKGSGRKACEGGLERLLIFVVRTGGLLRLASWPACRAATALDILSCQFSVRGSLGFVVVVAILFSRWVCFDGDEVEFAIEAGVVSGPDGSFDEVGRGLLPQISGESELPAQGWNGDAAPAFTGYHPCLWGKGAVYDLDAVCLQKLYCRDEVPVRR